MVISILVEGRLDEAVARRIIRDAGGRPGTTYGLAGASYIRKNISGFNGLAQGTPILCLIDLADVDPDCPISLVETWLPYRDAQMLFRVVVTEIESWLLADRPSIARFLGVRQSLVPYHPEELADPKASLVDLGRQSRFGRIEKGLVPADPTQHSQGPTYTQELCDFVFNEWNPSDAAEHSESLRRCIHAVSNLVDAQSAK